MEQRECHERKSDGVHRRVQELFTSLSVTLGGNYGENDAAGFEKVINRVRFPLWSLRFSSSFSKTGL